MTFSPLITRVALATTKFGPRLGSVVNHITPHHSAATSLEQVLAVMQSPAGREVSANYVIGNDGEIVGVVPEEYRAWTSGSPTDGGKGAAFDRRSITVEIINAAGAPGYPISDAAIDATIALFADIGRRYRFTMTRTFGGTFEGHRELYTRYGASYPTACPGVYPLDSAAAAVNALIAGKPATKNRNDNVYQFLRKTFPQPSGTDRFSKVRLVDDHGRATEATNLNAAGSADRKRFDDMVAQFGPYIEATDPQWAGTDAFLLRPLLDANLVLIPVPTSGGGTDSAAILAAIAKLPAQIDAQLDDEQAQLITGLAALPEATRKRISDAIAS